VSFAGKSAETVADSAGAWHVALPALAASKEGRVLSANDATVTDVLVGEVWFCSGQSNMVACPLVGAYPRYRDACGGMIGYQGGRNSVGARKFMHPDM
jgi:hypothetical protein